MPPRVPPFGCRPMDWGFTMNTHELSSKPSCAPSKLSKTPFARARKLTLKLATIGLLAAFVAGCAANRTPIATTEANIAKVRCAGWKQQTYDSQQDTKETTDQIKAHNLYGQKVGCWTAKKGKK